MPLLQFRVFPLSFTRFLWSYVAIFALSIPLRLVDCPPFISVPLSLTVQAAVMTARYSERPLPTVRDYLRYIKRTL